MLRCCTEPGGPSPPPPHLHTSEGSKLQRQLLTACTGNLTPGCTPSTSYPHTANMSSRRRFRRSLSLPRRRSIGLNTFGFEPTWPAAPRDCRFLRRRPLFDPRTRAEFHSPRSRRRPFRQNLGMLSPRIVPNSVVMAVHLRAAFTDSHTGRKLIDPLLPVPRLIISPGIRAWRRASGHQTTALSKLYPRATNTRLAQWCVWPLL